jgi:SAM-dependent MidA family methyltransferase
VLSEPGFVDVTADVDFSQCAKAANRAFQAATVAGSVPSASNAENTSDKSQRRPRRDVDVTRFATQGEFLMNLGIRDRVMQLLEQPSTTDEQAAELVAAFKRLVGSHTSQGTNRGSNNVDVSAEYMGEKFKVLGICDPSIKQLPGF